MSKLRILQLNKLYSPWIGGIESVAKEIAEGLCSQTDMTVLVCQPKGRGKTETVNGVKVIRSGSMGIKFSMPISFSYPFLVRKYAKTADIIIVHDPFPLGDLSLLLSGFKGKAVVWWHSDIVKQKTLKKLISPIIHGVLKRADAIFTTSQKYIGGSEYISRYREKCRIIPYGIDVDEYMSVKQEPILTGKLDDKNNVKMLFVGRLVYYKGADVLIRAFENVCGAELFIVGTGADEQELKADAKKSGDRIHFLGRLSDRELKCAFADCDVFVFPSVEKSEAFGIVQLEAMVYGKPVINTDLDTSVPYVSVHGETGLTVPPGDAAALGKAMSTLADDKQLREKLGKNGRKRVDEQFTLDIMLEKAVREFHNLLEV